jgi:hypothetical protein
VAPGRWNEFGNTALAINLLNKDSLHAKVLDCSSDESSDDIFIGNQFCNVRRISLSPQEGQVLGKDNLWSI